MRKINTGKGEITILTLIAVWSISLVVDLPGLAISPIMSQLDVIFPHTTHLEIQLLAMLPNFCIIPFILLSGKLSVSKSRLGLINLGMAIFIAGGVACFFAKSIPALIIISCVIGVGCGLVIPLAAGVIADLFAGVERVKQMGIKSGIANFTLIFTTLVVGWIGTGDWHLPFIVYLVPVIPLCLSPFLTREYISKTASAGELRPEAPTPVDNHPHAVVRPLPTGTTTTDKQADRPTPLEVARTSRKSAMACVWGIMGFYFVITLCTIIITYYLPFIMQDYKMPDSDTSLVTSVFFLFITAAGFMLSYMVKLLRNLTTLVSMLLMSVGLLLMALFHSLWIYLVAVAAVGFGYGLLQPIFYTKASLLSPTSKEATKTISYIMTANYLGTAVTPLFFTGIQNAFHIQGHSFSFWLALALMAVILVFTILKRRSFVFFTSLKEA